MVRPRHGLAQGGVLPLVRGLPGVRPAVLGLGLPPVHRLRLVVVSQLCLGLEPLSFGLEPLSLGLESLSLGLESLSLRLESSFSFWLESVSLGLEPLSLEPLNLGLELLCLGLEALSLWLEALPVLLRHSFLRHWRLPGGGRGRPQLAVALEALSPVQLRAPGRPGPRPQPRQQPLRQRGRLLLPPHPRHLAGVRLLGRGQGAAEHEEPEGGHYLKHDHRYDMEL